INHDDDTRRNKSPMRTRRQESFQLHTGATTPPSNKLLDIPLTQPSVYVRYYRSFGFPCYLGIGCHESKAFSQRAPRGKRESVSWHPDAAKIWGHTHDTHLLALYVQLRGSWRCTPMHRSATKRDVLLFRATSHEGLFTRYKYLGNKWQPRDQHATGVLRKWHQVFPFFSTNFGRISFFECPRRDDEDVSEPPRYRRKIPVGAFSGDHVPQHVGPPVPCCCIKLVDVPEMDYFTKKNQGEVCVKGTNVFVGYFKDPERTIEVIDEFGWHHTGDVGMWLPNGTLKIIDRRKHTFKLSQGEYIVPEKIESIYLRSQYVHQVFVHGESLKSCVVGIVIPDVDVVKCWAVENGIPGTLSVLCANPQVKQLIMDDMLSWGKEAGLKSFEQVKDIYLHPDPFSVQNGLLTPTLKMRRPQLKEYFKPQIEDLYRHLD
ncbi:unnamed protein product, partial [Heterotrigona itama]